MSTARTSGPRRVMLFTAVMVLGLLLGACGDDSTTDGIASVNGSDEESDPNETETSEADAEQALLDFSECMREHGVDIGDPEMDSEGNFRLAPPEGGVERNQDQFRDASEACQEHLDDADLGFDRGDRSEMEDALVEFAQCMRDEGIDMPDPEFSNGLTRFEGGSVDPDDPEFQRAREQCEDLLPGGFGGGGDR